MKGISICSECGNYNIKKHRCMMGCTKESNPSNPFFDDCPLVDVEPIIHAKWLHHIEDEFILHDYYTCSICGRKELEKQPYCNCGAKMDLNEPIKGVMQFYD